MTPSAPTSEIGSIRTGLEGWSALIDDIEHAPQLQWPQNLNIYRQMKTDAQVQALYLGTTLPIRNYIYRVEPNGARDEVVERLAEDLNLPIAGQEPRPIGRRKRRFSFASHVKLALEAPLWGHYYFEQVGEIVDGLWRLRKLAPRPPRSIEVVEVEDDGGLKAIKVPSSNGGPYGSATIPVDRLVAYVWDQEPGHWVGTSMLRAIYKNWLLKDRLIRIDLIKHDRAGAGIPTATGAPGMSRPQLEALDRMAREMKVDEEGGGAVPHGAKMELMGITGSVPDTWASIRGHNEEMARAWLAQVIQLGETQTGSRALGEVHLSSFQVGQDTMADWFVGTFNEHVVEDWVDWNYGEDEPAPLITFERPEDGSVAVADLATMVDKNMIEVDEELETWLRQNFKLPTKGTPRDRTSSSEPSPLTAKRRRNRIEAAGETPSPLLPDRDLRRQPYTHEIQAAVDFAAMDETFMTMSDELFQELIDAQAVQIDDLAEQIAKHADDPEALSRVLTPAISADDIEAVMLKTAREGAAGAADEAIAQGVKGAKAATIDETAIKARAQAAAEILSRNLSDTAAREAVRRAGSISADELAAGVKEFLLGLTGANVKKTARGVITRGINLGRTGFMKNNSPTRVYASELLDSATCEFCVAIDGQEFASLTEAMDYYPGGFIDCQGGENCRGTLVGVYGDEAPPTLER